MIQIEIDGKEISVPEGTTVIEAADLLGIYIPRFCYHKKLSIAANCRMCLIEVEKTGKPLPACATPVTASMRVHTTSPKAIEAQRAVMEYLLINHPLDCPICDQGGECDLQDLSMGYGRAISNYRQPKRAVFNDDLGPLIDTEMTRCIHCTRCVRFGAEIAGIREMGATDRGEWMQIGTYVKHVMKSEIAGNIIDLCPVGALTAKPSRYTCRGWEVREHPSIAMHDCVGTNVFFHSRGQEYAPQRIILRAVPRENEAINEVWMSDRDRFSYQGLYHEDRLLTPRIKNNGRWQETDWQIALETVAHRIQLLCKQQGPDQMAGLVSPNATLEECFLFQKWLRELDCYNIDHRLRQQDLSDQELAPPFPHLGMKLQELESKKAILLIGSDVRSEQPLISYRIYKASEEGAKIMVINPMDYSFVFPTHDKIIGGDIIAYLAQVTKVLLDQRQHRIDGLEKVQPTESAIEMAHQLMKYGDEAAILMGDFAINHPDGGVIRTLVRLIGELSSAAIGVLTEGANAAGAWLAGVIPHRGVAGAPLSFVGKHAYEVLHHSQKAYVLLNTELEFDSAYSQVALDSLKQASLVICFSPYITETMRSYADIILPIATTTETAGTFVNVEGTWQSFEAVSVPSGEAKPAWEVIQKLAQLMQCGNFNYVSQEQVREELWQLTAGIPNHVPKPVTHCLLPTSVFDNNAFLRLAPWPLYRGDSIVRRAIALQQTLEGSAVISVHPQIAEKLKLQAGQMITAIQGRQRITLPLMLDARLAKEVVLISSGLAETAGFGQATGPIHIEGSQYD